MTEQREAVAVMLNNSCEATYGNEIPGVQQLGQLYSTEESVKQQREFISAAKTSHEHGKSMNRIR